MGKEEAERVKAHIREDLDKYPALSNELGQVLASSIPDIQGSRPLDEADANECISRALLLAKETENKYSAKSPYFLGFREAAYLIRGMIAGNDAEGLSLLKEYAGQLKTRGVSE
jgi:hypothetical protein